MDTIYLSKRYPDIYSEGRKDKLRLIYNNPYKGEEWEAYEAGWFETGLYYIRAVGTYNQRAIAR